MKRYSIVAALILILTSCEYKEMAEVDINSTRYTFNETHITAMYQTIGSQTSSVVIADNGDVAITFTIKNNIKGLYTCDNGSSAMATIYITYDGDHFSTQYAGSSGVIDLVSAGGNLIEGTFNGNIKNLNNTYTIVVTNGKFSGRAY